MVKKKPSKKSAIKNSKNKKKEKQGVRKYIF